MGSSRGAVRNRLLDIQELGLVQRVFGTKAIPSWRHIAIGDGLGFGGAPYTRKVPFYSDELSLISYAINVGDVFDSCMAHNRPTNGLLDGNYGLMSELLIHEMVHVWQYFNGFPVILSSVIAGHLLGGYDFKPGDIWDDYNAEQQATLVERWFKEKESETSELFPYIDRIIRDGGKNEMLRATRPGTTFWTGGPKPLEESTLKVEFDNELLALLGKQYAASDVVGYGGRARKVEEYFSRLSPPRAKLMLIRLTSKYVSDQVAKLFYANLSPALIQKLLALLTRASAAA